MEIYVNNGQICDIYKIQIAPLANCPPKSVHGSGAISEGRLYSVSSFNDDKLIQCLNYLSNAIFSLIIHL